MSSDSDYSHAESLPHQAVYGSASASASSSRPPSPSGQSNTPFPSRPRLPSTSTHRRTNHDFKDDYNDAYRVLFNEEVGRAAAPFHVSRSTQHGQKQIGASSWSLVEQSTFFGALERLGRDDIAGIANAIKTKTEPEVREFLLLLHDAAQKQGYAKADIRDIPAAVEIGERCRRCLELAGDALAWHQERLEASLEQSRYGDYWLISPQIAGELEDGIYGIAGPSVASTPEPKRRCVICRSRHRKCNRQVPCRYCKRHDLDCVYSGDLPEKEPERATSAATQSYLHVRACTRCKKMKIRCDRQASCSNCERRKVDCTYPDQVLMLNPHAGTNDTELSQSAPETVTGSSGQDQSASVTSEAYTGKGDSDHDEGIHVPREVPEAYLLKAQTMLSLSRNIFMNRSPDIPSPWSHYSEYTSELATEPSMYRTAFKDFHTIVVSITRRLVQTAIIQATSRLRTNLRPGDVRAVVKKRDVITAIDILGLERNAIDRWKGVARRSGLRVWTRKAGHRRQLSWSEVERTLSSVVFPHGKHNSDAETSGAEDFGARATRSGTPLPLQGLSLSDSGEASASDLEREDSDTDERFDQRRAARRLKDSLGQHISEHGMTLNHPQTLEEFDQEASRQEERALLDMLGLQPEAEDVFTEADECTEEVGDEVSGRITTDMDDWRDTVAYRAEWEELSSPVPHKMFLSNQRPLPPMPAPSSPHQSTDGTSDYQHDRSSDSEASHDRGGTPIEVELQAHGTNAYAALQGQGLQYFEDEGMDINSEAEKADIPAQSIGTEVEYGVAEKMDLA